MKNEENINADSSNMQELDQMRQQMALLKHSLDRQLVVSDKLMRQSMKGKLQWIKQIATPLLILFFVIEAMQLELSMGPVVMLAVILAVSVTADYIINVKRAPDFMAGTLVATQEQLLSMKRLRMWSFAINLPLSLIWAAWFIIDMYMRLPVDHVIDTAHSAALTGGIVGGSIGLVAGLVVAVVIVRKMQKTNDSIIDQLKDLGGD